MLTIGPLLFPLGLVMLGERSPKDSSSKRLRENSVVVENKQHKQLIDRAKSDDIHLPFQQFFIVTILIYTAAF